MTLHGTAKQDGPGPTNALARLRPLLPVVVAAIAFVLLGKVSLYFAAKTSYITPVWLPSGLATALLVRYGWRILPGLAVGSLGVSFLYTELSILGALGTLVADMGEAAIAYALLRRLRFQASMPRTWDVLALILASTLAASAYAATVGTAVFCTQGYAQWHTYGSSWFTYWLANATSSLTVAPAVLAWLSAPHGAWLAALQRPLWKVEALAILMLLVVIGYLVFFAPRSRQVMAETEYALFPLVVWAGFRFGPRSSSLGIIIITLFAVWGTTLHEGPFGHYEFGSGLLMMQAYLAIFALTGHLIAAVAEERLAARNALLDAKSGLEHTVAQRTSEIQNTNAFLNVVLDNVSAAITACDAKGNITVFNRRMKEIYGNQEEKSAPADWAQTFKIYQPDGITPIADENAPLLRALRGEEFNDEEMVIRPTPDLSYTVSVSGQPIRNPEGEIVSAVIAGYDVTERKRSEELQQIYHRVATASNQAKDAEAAIPDILSAICSHFALAASHALEVTSNEDDTPAFVREWWCSNPAHQLDKLVSINRPHLQSGLPGEVLASGRHAWLPDISRDERFSSDSFTSNVSLFAFPVLAGGRIASVIEIFSVSMTQTEPWLEDLASYVGLQLGRVYERSEARKGLIRMAMRDALTGLPNRPAFLDMLRQTIAHHKRKGEYKYAVFFIDLDRFKVINDSLGHAAGDQLLQEAARRIQRCLRAEDAVARLGGDEFTVLLADLGKNGEIRGAAIVAERILNELETAFLIEGEQVFVSASIGIVGGGEEYDDPNELLRDADAAMYRAKAAGKGRIELFSPHMHQSAMTLLRLESHLRKAIELNEFVLHYQPLVSLRDGQIEGFEALLRWSRPDAGLIPPAEFIPIAEETGLIVPIGRWVMNEACRWLAALSENPMLPPYTMNVNVSGVQFAEGGLIDYVKEALATSQLPPSRLKLEITESTLMENRQAAVEIITELRELGVQVVIDDFGTGYSSLSYLSKLPIDALKVDRSFIKEMTTTDESSEIVRAIIAMAAAMGLDLVAEGIETQEQSEALQQLNCRHGQGYFFSRPVDGDAATKLVLEQTATFSRNRAPA